MEGPQISGLKLRSMRKARLPVSQRPGRRSSLKLWTRRQELSVVLAAVVMGSFSHWVRLLNKTLSYLAKMLFHLTSS